MQDLSGPEGRRERKKRETRSALKAAALDLVSRHGFNNVTVEDIANAVDVSVRTFFNYFSSKEAALVGEDPELIDALKDELVALPAELSPLEAVRTVLLRRIMGKAEDINASGEGQAAWLARFSAVRTQPEVMLAYSKHLTRVEQALTDALVERLGDQRLRGYASLVTTCALSVIRVAGSLWAGQGGACPFYQVADAALDLLSDGLSIGSACLADGDLPDKLAFLGGPCGPSLTFKPEVRTA